MVLLLIAFIGLLVPNSMFIYALLHDFPSIAAALSDTMALSLLIDAFMATGLFAYLFAVRPVGPITWPWFVALSLLGGLGFSVPFYLWLNWRRSPLETAFAAWWRNA